MRVRACQCQPSSLLAVIWRSNLWGPAHVCAYTCVFSGASELRSERWSKRRRLHAAAELVTCVWMCASGSRSDAGCLQQSGQLLLNTRVESTFSLLREKVTLNWLLIKLIIYFRLVFLNQPGPLYHPDVNCLRSFKFHHQKEVVTKKDHQNRKEHSQKSGNPYFV